ncbi:peptidoglycan DD-metalloendopeptidase family protein, partial [Micromonospora sp. NPDC049060]|uniref:M23 family metallopeptidase n=1 Tax=Micromonospora sp. NPDC049060 TaxID=3154828 RepID=UPI0033F8C0A6
MAIYHIPRQQQDLSVPASHQSIDIYHRDDPNNPWPSVEHTMPAGSGTPRFERTVSLERGSRLMAGNGISRRTFLHTTVAAGAITAVGSTAGAALAAVPGFYNPFSGYPITGTWQDHLNRGSLGGIDYGMPVGTQLPAAGGGIVTNIPNNGTGGHTVTIAHDNGYRTQYMHLSQFSLTNGTRVGMGQIVGLSGGAVGAPGSGSSTGPHLHWHMINPSGTRINPLAYLDSGGPSL